MRGRETAQYVTSRRFGEATVTLIDDGIVRWNPQLPIPETVRRQVMPEAEADGTLALGLHVAHIQLGDASILVDTGYDDPSPDFARAHPNFTSSPGVRAGLASMGIRPEAITSSPRRSSAAASVSCAIRMRATCWPGAIGKAIRPASSPA